MYNSIYPVNIHYTYKTNENKKKVQSKEEENANSNGGLSNGNAHLTEEELKHRYHQNNLNNYANREAFNLNTYQTNNHNNTINIHNRKRSVNIHQIVSDFRKTQIAINAPDDVVYEVNKFLSNVDNESKTQNPQPKVIQNNLKEASKLLDDYISKTLNKDSHVVEGWLNALFLQDIDYKHNPYDINETFKLKFPKGSKVDEKISKNLDILYPDKPSSSNNATNVLSNDFNINQQDVPFENETSSTNLIENNKPETLNNVNDNFVETGNKEVEINNSNIISLDKKIIPDEKKVTLPKLENENQNIKTQNTKSTNNSRNYIPTDETLKSLFTQAKILGNAKDYQNALDFYENALNYANEIGDTQMEPIIYYEVAKVYDKTDNINIAIEYYSNAINTSNSNFNIKALSHMALGKIYDDSSLIDASLDHYVAACSYGGESENTKLQSYALLDIGEIYASTYNKDAALNFIETAKNIANDTSDSKTIGKIYSKSAKTYKNFNENLQALKDLKISTMEFDKVSNESKNQIENYIMAASILIDLNNGKKAKSLINKALNIANEANLYGYLPQINSLNKLLN